MARANFTIDIGSRSGIEFAWDIECIAESYPDGPELMSVFVCGHGREGKQVCTQLTENDGLYSHDPVLKLLSKLAWERARDLDVTQRLRIAWDEDASDRAEARAAYRYDSNRHAGL